MLVCHAGVVLGCCNIFISRKRLYNTFGGGFVILWDPDNAAKWAGGADVIILTGPWWNTRAVRGQSGRNPGPCAARGLLIPITASFRVPPVEQTVVNNIERLQIPSKYSCHTNS